MLAYATLSSPNDVEAMQALVMTLGTIGDVRAVPVLERALRDPDRTVAVRAAASLERITGGNYAGRVQSSSDPVYTDYDWKTLESIPEHLELELTTSRGVITVELLRDEAPFTVLSVVKLVRKDFYDGLSFHRVVPDFVIQGGDPRGDGWGGPGYSIRTETAPVNYYRGMVGIASAGKDTEGCQFFITHSSQPHLDGRYTIFARVLRGMSVVDAIQVGDTITDIAVKK
jgi:cyclophilin family peptidyl-prolyl cis-trans isomerase